MLNTCKYAFLGAALAASVSFAHASPLPITLGSYGSVGLTSDTIPTVANSATYYIGYETYPTVAAIPASPGPVVGQAGTGFTATGIVESVDLNPETPIWNAALPSSNWVGINQNAGPQSTVNPAYGYYEFQTLVSGLTSSYGGSLTVMADDTTEIYLTNSAGTSLLIPFGSLGGDGHCADNAPTCSVSDTVSLSLLPGDDLLTFIVEQAGTGLAGGTGDPSGLNFDATLSPTPEPNSLILFGTGLVGAAGILMRKRVAA